MWPDDVIDRFGARKCGKGWCACCPSHNDRTPSLALYMGRNGALILGCFAGCCKQDILRRKGLTMKDLFPPQSRAKDEPYVQRRIADIYPYTDESGRVLYEKVRYEPKDFRCRTPDGRWCIDGVRRVPFMLCEMIERPKEPVLVVEGEKDALAAHSLGLLGTCTVEGAGGGWEPDSPYPPYFAGRRVVIIPDEDRPGVNHAQKVVGALLMNGVASVRVARLPCKDLYDYVAAGNRAGHLIDLVRKTKEWKPQ